jgi:hypothetical protein
VQISAEDAIVVSGQVRRHVPQSVDALFGQSRLLSVNVATLSPVHTHEPANSIYITDTINLGMANPQSVFHAEVFSTR